MKNRWMGVLAFAALPAPVSLGGVQYGITLLGNANGSEVGNVYAVSSFGAVGDAFVGDFFNNPLQVDVQPVIWQGSVAGQLPVPAGYHGSAKAVNSLGDAAGYVWSSNVNAAQPAAWHNGALNVLDTLGMPYGNAYAINDQGTVVGAINGLSNSVYQGQAVSWTGSQATVLGNFPGAQAWAHGVNNQGQVLVLAAYPDETETWVWTNGSLTQITSLGGRAVGGLGINDLGHVVGTAIDATDAVVGFIWENGTTTALPNLIGDASSYVEAINNSDQIVGSGIDANGGFRAVLWQNGQAFNLNDLISTDSGAYLLDATDIADNGTIVANGYFNGAPASFLLTPTASPSGSTPTPEPATAATLLLAAPLLLRRRRRSV